MNVPFRRLAALCAVIAVAGLTVVGMAAADVENGNLPGGTAISVEISSPADGAVFQLGDPVPISGNASIGLGVPNKDTSVTFIVDRSGSMTLNAGADCTGDGINDSRFVCVKQAVNSAIAQAATAFSAVDLVGIASFASSPSGTAHDVDLGAAGSQLLVAPGHDGNGNGSADAADVVNSLVASGNTCYSCGLDAGESILNSPLNSNPKNLVIFLSDGENNQGANLNVAPAPSFPAGTIVKAIGLGAGLSCASDGFGLGSMNDVAGYGAAGSSCVTTTDFSAVAGLIEDALGSTLSSVSMTIDGNPAAFSSLVPAPPLAGPAATAFSATALGLAAGPHSIAVTASGSDGFGAGSVTDVHTILVNAPPDCSGVSSSLSELWPPNGDMHEVSLSGATDPDGNPVSLSITGVTQDEVVAGPGNNRSPDAAAGSNASSVQLRAERFGGEDGRVYRIAYVVSDGLGGSCSGTVAVSVPHDQSGDAAVDSGGSFDSFLP